MDVIERIFSDNINLNADAIIEQHGTKQSRITHAEMRKLIRQIAYEIQNQCKQSERVCILLSQSINAYCSELAALYVGCVFCPLESTYPDERIKHCLDEFSPALVLTDQKGVKLASLLGYNAVDVNDIKGPLANNITPSEDAYVIFTSGSTGKPKGVLVSRRSMNKFLEWSYEFYDVNANDRWAQFSGIGFDLSLVDMLTCLPMGGSLYSLNSKFSKMFPNKFIKKNQITIWHSVPSMIPLMLNNPDNASEELKSLRIASFCGEPLFPQQALRLIETLPYTKIVNTYGPTEGTFFCSIQVVDKDLCLATNGTSLPIGMPIPGWNFAFIPQEDNHYELVLVSDYLSNGYISSTKDQKRFGFTHDKISSYNTGDLVKRHDEKVIFSCRNDNQIKIRGNRLDLSEVDYHALNLGAKEAKTIFYQGSIFLFLTEKSGAKKINFGQDLMNSLPQYAQPADIFILESFPRNANSKIDNGALVKIIGEKWGD